MKNDKPNFLDRNTVIAFVVILVFWVGWSQFMNKQYPAKPVETASQAGGGVNSANPPAGNAPSTTEATTVAPTAQAAAATMETFTQYEDDNIAFRVSSKGMGLRDINVKHYQTRTNEPVILGTVENSSVFATQLAETNQLIDFQVEQPTPGTFVGRANINGYQIEKTMKLDSAKYAFDTQIKVVAPQGGIVPGFKGISTTITDFLLQSSGGSFFAPSYDHQDWFVRHDNTKTRKIISTAHSDSLIEPNVTLAALSAHYFTLAIVDRSPLLPRFDSTILEGAKEVTGRLTYAPGSQNDFVVQYTAFAGPKSFDLLSKVDENLTTVIDYGIFGVLGKPILWLLKYLQTLVGNWGFAIILLTIIVRLIVLPFNAYSFKAMKAMQKIQPEMNRIKERYKDKTAPEQKMQMNQEIMALMKENKANPLGGCLPTLLQLPVFFALFQVLGQSIELYRAPFIFWIHDLSVKDPFYVLPVLMAITMFVQQKITPTTMDPQQAKIMMWMPVIFAVFMLTLPSGLTLYIFVSTLFGIIQQYYFMRDKKPVQEIKEAKA